MKKGQIEDKPVVIVNMSSFSSNEGFTYPDPSLYGLTRPSVLSQPYQSAIRSSTFYSSCCPYDGSAPINRPFLCHKLTKMDMIQKQRRKYDFVLRGSIYIYDRADHGGQRRGLESIVELLLQHSLNAKAMTPAIGPRSCWTNNTGTNLRKCSQYLRF